ncbi:MAG: sigma-54 interaction domain-containing protein, partial [Desulfohalobiaceae bacterium]
VIIQSPDQVYAGYLQSLVQQVPLDPDLEVQCLPPKQKGQVSQEESRLLVVYQDLDKGQLQELVQASTWSRVILVNSNGKAPGSKIKESNAVQFSRPLDTAAFVSSVYHWCQDQVPACHVIDSAPVEPYLVGNNQAIRKLRRNMAKICKSDLTVLICGATGTGKGVVAQALHNNSRRACNQFLDINCANVPASLLESELFGYKKGAFTGAWRDKPGRFELVQEGTIFLDEISEMTPYMQAKLLQVLQEKEFYPVGGSQSVQVKARLLAATNADLQQNIAQGSFREDLYYRLAVVKLDLPRLKDRLQDVPILVEHFLDKYCRLYNKQEVPRLSDELWDLLLRYDWPGNVRELESNIKNLVALEQESLIKQELRNRLPENAAKVNEQASQGEDVSLGLEAEHTKAASLSDSELDLSQELPLKELTNQVASKAEADLIRKVLQQTGGKKKQAARMLDISYKCLLKKIKTYGI